MAKPKKNLSLVKIIAKVEKLIGRGEWLRAALMIKEASLPEDAFDEIMADRPALRAVFLTLA